MTLASGRGHVCEAHPALRSLSPSRTPAPGREEGVGSSTPTVRTADPFAPPERTGSLGLPAASCDPGQVARCPQGTGSCRQNVGCAYLLASRLSCLRFHFGGYFSIRR